MSRKSNARRASNARSFAFTPTRTTKRPTHDKPANALEQRELLRKEAAYHLGFNSPAEMDEHHERILQAEEKLPPTAGTERSLQYLATQLLRERDGNQCYLCRKDMTELKAVVEHIIPISRGGENEPSNVALSCTQCNHRKGGCYVSLTVPSGKPVYHYPRT